MNPLLSIIVPVFNAEVFLDECLESIVSQDYDNIEIICVNDGSTDKSLKILEKWMEKDNRFRIINETNRGPSAARNNGIKAAKGDFITFVDADDIVRNKIYSVSIKQMKENSLDVFIFACESFPNGNVRTTGFQADIVMDAHQMFASNKHIQSTNALCFSCRFVFRTSIIKNNDLLFDERIRYGEDMVFNIDAICHSQRIMVTNEPFYLYRKNEMGAMSQAYKPLLEDSLVKAYDIKMEQIEKYHLDTQNNYREDIAEYYIKTFLPMLVKNEFHRPDQKDIRAAIKHIISLKMIKDSFNRIGFKNIYSSQSEYVFYLIQKFKIYPVISYIYIKTYLSSASS